jgi:glycosyltransferase involved in cell wall biosynthesis
MKKILYVKHADSSFILNDQRILEKKYRVVPFLVRKKQSGTCFACQMVSLCLFVLFNARGSSAMVTWFGDYHSALMVFLGRLSGIRVFIFAGGQEAICYPELGKGVYLKKWRGRCVRYALRNAAMIIPNHSSLIYHENTYLGSPAKIDGIRHYVPGLETPVTIIPNGINTSKFYRDAQIQKDPRVVLTAGTMNSPSDFINKGFDLFTDLARRNPGLKFILTGIKQRFLPWIEERYHILSVPNLELIYSFCPDEVLFEAYNRAWVFVQASITEGMPNTLNEAMLCECVPVGSNVNGIPDAIGETGELVYHRDIVELEAAVMKALQADTGPAARERVLCNFTLELREERVLRLFQDTL